MSDPGRNRSDVSRTGPRPISRAGLGLLLAAVICLIVIIFLLSQQIVSRYRKLQLDGAAESASIYIEAVLAPAARRIMGAATDHTADVDFEPAVADLPRLPGRFSVRNIWDEQGELVYTSATKGDLGGHDDHGIELALKGELVVELHETRDATARSIPMQPPFIEVYLPIFDPTNNRVVAVGEIYQDASALIASRDAAERILFLSVAIASTLLAALVWLIAVQNGGLNRQLTEARELLAQNVALRKKADALQQDAGRANEQLLNRIGADLHDGPVQLLSLAALKLGRRSRSTDDGNDPHDLIARAAADLRTVASGLVLPEMHDLTLHQALQLAAKRHEELTETKVDLWLMPLPEVSDEAVRICLYRFVQEGLNNAYHHAGGHGQCVSANESGSEIIVTVADAGAGPSPRESTDVRPSGGLGLHGIRHRIEAVGGSLLVESRSGGGTLLTARVPVG